MSEESVSRRIVGEVLSELVNDLRSGRSGNRTRVGLMASGSELVTGNDGGQTELINGAVQAMKLDPSVEVVMIGPRKTDSIPQDLAWIETADCEADIASGVEKALAEGSIASAVALHYPFPLGVATIGRVVTPFRGKEMIIASTTGTTSTNRVEAMVLNAVYGNAVAKAIGIARPSVGVLSVDGAPTAARILAKLRDGGYSLLFGESKRGDGGSLLRGNDLLTAAVDVVVTDTLTGNILMKLFSSWGSGGSYESTGFGYGPSVGQGWERIVAIISRASGAPVIASAIRFAAEAVSNNLPAIVKAELAAAEKAGLAELLASASPAAAAETVTAPPAKPVGEEIHGVDVLAIDDAVKALWAAGIYAEAAMGCTGPVVKTALADLEKAHEILSSQGYV